MTVGRGKTQSCFPSPLPGRTRASRSLGASQPRLAAGPGSPAVPGLAGVGAAASMTPARSGPACPVHLDKLRLTGAQSLWSRRPPDASLPTQLPRAGSGQVAGMGWRAWGEREARPLPGPRRGPGLAPGKAAGPLFPVRSREAPGQTRPVWPSPQSSRLMLRRGPSWALRFRTYRPLKGVASHPRARARARCVGEGAFPPAFGRLPQSFGDPITLGAPDY